MVEKSRKDQKKKKTRRRKIRRDADVSSSSDSEREEPREKNAAKGESAQDSDVEMDETAVVESANEDTVSIEDTNPAKQKPFSEADFSSWYLRQVTKELEEDLDSVRSAGDFKDSSLPVLISALRQGASLFSLEEKQRLLGLR